MAKWMFVAWTLGVPLLACGLSLGLRSAIVAGAALLLGVILNVAQGLRAATG